MTDRYIDQDETLIYGPYASAQLRSVVMPLDANFSAAVEYVAGLIDHATSEVSHQLDAARGTDADRRGAVETKQPVLVEAKSFLARFSKYLDSQKGADRKVFFPTDGTSSGEGHSGPKVLLSISRIAGKLATPPASLTGAAAWKTEADTLVTSLTPALTHANGSKTARRAQTPALEAARVAWLTTYTAAKSLATAVLTLSGHADLLSEVFYDLQVPGTTKVTTAPTPAPAPPAAS